MCTRRGLLAEPGMQAAGWPSHVTCLQLEAHKLSCLNTLSIAAAEEDVAGNHGLNPSWATEETQHTHAVGLGVCGWVDGWGRGGGAELKHCSSSS
jgi:hypothetical protein